MNMPMLAAGLAAVMISAAPSVSQTFSDANKASALFQPLTCAMANSGSCDLYSTAHRTKGRTRDSDIYLMATPEVPAQDSPAAAG